MLDEGSRSNSSRSGRRKTAEDSECDNRPFE